MAARVDAAPPGSPMHMNALPAVSGDTVYVSTGDGHLVAVSRRHGRILCSTLLDSHLAPVLYSSPVAFSRTLIVGVPSVQNAIKLPVYDFHGSIVALDTPTGRVRRRTWVMQPARWPRPCATGPVRSTHRSDAPRVAHR